MNEGNGDQRVVPYRREQSATLGKLFKAWAAAKLESIRMRRPNTAGSSTWPG